MKPPRISDRLCRVLLVAWLAVVSTTALPATDVLLERGSEWLFFRGTAPPSAPDQTLWRSRRFCDGGWETGHASIGYGDDDDATVLDDMQGGYVTVYARATFAVADPAAIESLLLTADYDDGFICYVNGREAVRVNSGAAAEELGFDAPATASHEAGVPEAFDLAASIGDLRAGSNTIAVEVRNVAIDSSDLTFDARLTANKPPPDAPQLPVELGSEWRFFRGRTAPSSPDATAWRGREFDDAAWEAGPTSIGYGDDDDATVLDDMPGNYVAVYARQSFELVDPARASSLLLAVDWDDCFICYLNGIEIARANAGDPGVEMSFDEVAPEQREAGAIEVFDVSASRGALVAGPNVIACEVHNADIDSSDLTFNASLSMNTTPPGAFEDSGIEFGGSKAAWADFDDDGRVDLLAGARVWRNDRGRRLVEVANVGGDGIWGDYDNDGDLDIFVYSSRRLFRQEGGGSFVDVTAQTLPELPMVVTRGAVWGDFDGDAFIDLYVGGYEAPGYQPDAILLNDAGRSFRIIWTQSGDVDPARGITAADFDEDGDLDVYVSNYRLEQNQLWRNDGGGGFTNAGPALGVQGIDDGWTFSYGHTIGSAWGDLDDDGHIDLFVGNFSHPAAHQDRPRFYRNLGPTEGYRFADLSGGAGLAWQESFASPALGDMDNDGDLDLYFTTVYAGDHSVLYENRGGFRFGDVTGPAGIPVITTYQAAWADFDGDGDLDLATGGRLFRNTGRSAGGAVGAAGNWLAVRLRGDGIAVNTAAIGAQIRVSSGGRTITRQVESGTGEGNQNDLTLHFGLGSQTGSVPVEVFWPDGTVESTTAAPNRIVDWTYGFSACGAARRLPEKYVDDPSTRVTVSIDVRNVSDETTVRDVFPTGWIVTREGDGLVDGRTIAFTVSQDRVLEYELQPGGPCETVTFRGTVSGPGECDSMIAGAATIACAPEPDPIELVTEGTEIAFLRGTVAPPPLWRAVEFEDCAWDEGLLGIGYGDGDDRTVLDDMATGAYAVVFGRARFDLRDHGFTVAQVESLQLAVRFDDGFAAYLNGQEIARANLPGGGIDESTLATSTVSDAPASCGSDDPAAGCAVVDVPVERLVDGANALTFSVHNVSAASSDLSFIPTLSARIRAVAPELFRRGDSNSSGAQDITDAVLVLSFLFQGGQAPACMDAADVDDDGRLTISDAVTLLYALFQGDADRVPPPGLDCGPDPTEDALGTCATTGC